MFLKSLLLTALAIVCIQASANNNWLTWYEAHGKNQTPRYDETIEFSKRLAEVSPELHYTTFGQSHQLRELPLLILDRQGRFTPEQVHASGNIVLLVQAAIHPGEPDGKDAGLLLLRDMVIDGKYRDLLENITLLFIPIFNLDGHERFGPFNRINQNGPEEMGWRTNSRNLNLNRDFLKADAIEMQHFLKLWNDWQPDFYIDTHSTNGGDYQYPMTYIIEIFGNMEKGISDWCEQDFLPEWENLMEKSGYPAFPYVTYRNWHDPRSGLVSRTSPPALSNGFAAQRNRPGLLLETHMLKPYHLRVEATYFSILHTMELLQRDHNKLKELNNAADAFTASAEFRAQPFHLDFRTASDSVMIDFKGVEYQKIISDLSGGQWFIYESDKPASFQIPWFHVQKPSVTVKLPEAYIIPVQWYDVIERLQMHGIEMTFLTEEKEMEVESYRFRDVNLAGSVNEGRQMARFTTVPVTETRRFPAGSAIIPMNQPEARLIAHALEPDAPSSFAAWGFFNATFQRTEYFESYAMEAIARQMLQDDPDLQKRFEEKKATDQAFASNPREILNWFYEQTPYYDQEHNVYPVGRVMRGER
jgi:hypothetical protein